jgi:two-component system, NtrC family, sensor kinase
MRLIVRKAEQTVNELQFDRGPIYIGRHAHSQVFLPDRAVSRQHAAIFTTQDGRWVVEDLDSTNKTYLNDEPIHKGQIKTGDRLRIADFEIEIDLEAGVEAGQAINLEDTLVASPRKPAPAPAASRDIIVRNPEAQRAPDIRLPAKRIKDFLQATEAICKSNGPDEVVETLLSITLKDLGGYRTWCGLRALPEGPMTCHAGRNRDGEPVELGRIDLREKVAQAIETRQFMLIPRVTSGSGREQIRSAMIAPIMDPSGCFGVLYVDHSIDQDYYNLSDLDYLMLLAIHTAAVVENF